MPIVLQYFKIMIDFYSHDEKNILLCLAPLYFTSVTCKLQDSFLKRKFEKIHLFWRSLSNVKTIGIFFQKTGT